MREGVVFEIVRLLTRNPPGTRLGCGSETQYEVYGNLGVETEQHND